MTRFEDGVGFPIRATDQFSAAFDSLVGKTQGAQRSIEQLTGYGQKLAAVLTTGAFAIAIKGAIDYADKLNDLSKITGVSVQTLDGLSYAAKTAGVDLDAVAKGLGKMQKNLFDAAAGNKELSIVFQKMGIDVKSGMKDVEGTFLKLAGQFEKMPGDAERSAAAVKIFGKEGAALIPLLTEGADKLREMIAEQRRWGGVSEETAARADAFNDTIEKLKMISSAFWRELASSLLPTLQKLADMLVTSKEKGDGFQSWARGIGEVFKWVAGAALVLKTVIQQVGDGLGALIASNVAFFKGDFRESLNILGSIKDRSVEIWSGLGGDLAKIFGEAGVAAAPAARKTGLGLADAVKKGADDGFQSILDGLNKKLAGAESPYNKELAETIVKLDAYEKKVRKLTDAERDEALEKAQLLDVLRSQKLVTEQLRALNNEFDNAIADDISRSEQVIRGLQDGNTALKTEIELVGQSATVRALRNVELERERALRDVIDQNQRNRINSEFDERARLIQQRDVLQENIGLWSQASDLVGGFASQLTNGVGSAIDYLKQQFKSLLAEMVAIFAKRWFLNMAAGATGMSSFSAMAAQQGQGSLAGSLFNTFSSGGGMAGSLLSSLGGSIIGMGGGFAGGLGAFVGGIGELGLLGSMGASASAGFTALGAGNIMGGLGSLLGPAAIAIGAIYALHKAFGDKGENWKGRLGFGSQASAYSTQGLFGPEGFAYLAGNDATNRSIQSFMASTGGIDKQLAGSLSGQQIEAIKAQLAGYNRRTDGQPAEFAFGKNDQTAAAQLTLEYLKVKYGAVFDQLDKTFADYIRSYTGKSEDLVKELASFSAVLEQLQGTGVKGLNLNSLRALQQDGEELSATFTRVAQGMSSINSMFVDESDAYLQALKLVGDEFSAMGIDMPVTADTFKTLRDGLDLSTQAGRDMFDMLVRVAPAMQQIDQATRNMMNGFNAAMGQIFGSGFSRQLLEIQATGLLSRFQSMTGIAAGMDPLALFKSIGGQNPADLQYIMSTFGPEVQTLLTQILQLYAQYIGLQEKVNESTGTMGQVFSSTVDTLASARKGLQDYLLGSLLNERLSPLLLNQRAQVAGDEYQRLLGLARGGNADAINGLGNARDTYLELQRQLTGPGTAFNALFFRTYDETRSVAGGGPTWQSAMVTLAAAVRPGSQLATEETMQEVATLLTFIAAGQTTQGSAQAAALAAAAEKLVNEMRLSNSNAAVE